MKKYRIVLLAIMSVLLLTGCGSDPLEEGLTYLQEGNYTEAIVKFEEAVKEENNIDEAYRGIGIAKWEMQDYEGARSAFRIALNYEAKLYASTFNLLGACEMKLENYKMAANYYRLGIQMEDCTEDMRQEMRFNEIAALEKMGDLENAKLKLAEYVADYPDDAQAAKEAEFFETR